MKKLTIENIIVLLLMIFLSAYGSLWLFNHINAWLGIGTFLVMIYILIKLLQKTIKKNQSNEKN